MSKIEGVTKNKILDYDHLVCPVCGKTVRFYDVCPNCNWQNNGDVEIDGGPNKMTLEEARKAYAEGRPVD